MRLRIPDLLPEQLTAAFLIVAILIGIVSSFGCSPPLTARKGFAGDALATFDGYREAVVPHESYSDKDAEGVDCGREECKFAVGNFCLAHEHRANLTALEKAE